MAKKTKVEVTKTVLTVNVDDGSQGKFVVLDTTSGKRYPQFKTLEGLLSAMAAGSTLTVEKAFCQFDWNRHNYIVLAAKQLGVQIRTLSNKLVNNWRLDRAVVVRPSSASDQAHAKVVIEKELGISYGGEFTDEMACEVQRQYTLSPVAVFMEPYVNGSKAEQFLEMNQIRNTATGVYNKLRRESTLEPIVGVVVPTEIQESFDEVQALVDKYLAYAPEELPEGFLCDEFTEDRLVKFIIPMVAVLEAGHGFRFFKGVVSWGFLHAKNGKGAGPWRAHIFHDWMPNYIRAHHGAELVEAGHPTRKDGKPTVLRDKTKMTTTCLYTAAFRKEFEREVLKALRWLFKEVNKKVCAQPFAA